MSIVYVIQAPSQSREFKSAFQYGRVEFILSASERVSILPAKALGILRRKLRHFKAEDYIVWAGGDPLAPILAGIVLGEMAFTEINYLKWEREKSGDGLRTGNGYYVPGKLMLKNVLPKTEVFSEDL